MGLVTDAWTYNAYGELASYTASTGGTVFSEVVDTATNPRDQLGRIVTRVEQNGAAPITREARAGLELKWPEESRGFFRRTLP